MPMISFQGLQIRYEFQPATKVAKGNLLFLHTIGLALEDFDGLVPYFQEDYNILRYDLLGHGESQRGDEFLSMQMLVDQLDFMSTHFFEERFTIIAKPAAGYIATRFARHHGERISGLVLGSPPPTYLPRHERENIVQQMQQRATVSFSAYQDYMLSHLTIHEEKKPVLQAHFDKTTQQTYFEFMSAYLTENLNADFEYLKMPILVLAGSQDTLFPTSVYGMTASFLGADFRVVPDAAILVGVDNPEHTAHLISEFLHKLPLMTADANVAASSDRTGFVLNQSLIQNAIRKGFDTTNSRQTLQVNLMNTFQVRVGNTEITQGWNLRRTKSLLLYLLFNGRSSREELIDALWPQADIKKAQNLLRVGLNQLRSLINQPDSPTILHADRESVFLQCDIDCDALRFIERLNEAYRQTDVGTRMQLAAQVLEVSPRKCMTQLYDDWFLRVCEDIEGKYYRLCTWVAEQLRAANRVDEAAVYERKTADLS